MIEQTETILALFEGHPERWCRGNFAEDADGEFTFGTDPKAVRFCVIGAVQKIYRPRGDVAEEEARGKLKAEARKRGAGTSAVSFNDSCDSFEEFLDFVRAAGV